MDHQNRVAAWLDVLHAAKIPSRHWQELYLRSINLRAFQIADGKEPSQFSPELFIALWRDLKAEIEQAAIESKRQLPTNAASACLRCFGTGWQRMYSNGEYSGVRPGCLHEPLGDEEGREMGL